MAEAVATPLPTRAESSMTSGSALGGCAGPEDESWPGDGSPSARIFHDWLGGRGQNRRAAGFSRCHRDCIADFPIGRVSKFRGVRGFGNPRYGRLGSLRYRIAYEISGLKAEGPPRPLSHRMG